MSGRPRLRALRPRPQQQGKTDVTRKMMRHIEDNERETGRKNVNVHLNDEDKEIMESYNADDQTENQNDSEQPFFTEELFNMKDINEGSSKDQSNINIYLEDEKKEARETVRIYQFLIYQYL